MNSAQGPETGVSAIVCTTFYQLDTSGETGVSASLHYCTCYQLETSGETGVSAIVCTTCYQLQTSGETGVSASLHYLPPARYIR